jgi:hypothetical protein
VVRPENPSERTQGCDVVSAQTSGIRARVASGRHGKYQLDVTACDVTDLVRHAGGWLYDRAMAGWDVSVLLSREGDVTPLRILGLRTQRPALEDDSSAPARALALATSADALAANPLLREDVFRAMKRGLVEVTLWGDFAGGQQRSDPGRRFGANGVDRGVESVTHVLSSAARAFKAHALRAAGLDEPVGPVETFLHGPTAFLVG